MEPQRGTSLNDAFFFGGGCLKSIRLVLIVASGNLG